MKYLLTQFLGLINAVKDNRLAWQTANRAQVQQLKLEQTLAEQDLAAQLNLKSLELAHSVDLLKTRQATELAMLKTRCEDDIKDYQQYLKSLEQLKLLTQASFSHLPEAVSLTIHHHAKALLNRMWETADRDEKIKLEAELIKFMTTVHEEAQLGRQQVNNAYLPENTLKLIENNALH